VLAGDGIHPGETGGRIYADTVTHAVDAVAISARRRATRCS
jgi:hypothetical protein